MRIVLKPVGLIFLAACLTFLIGIAIWRRSSPLPPAQVATVAVPSAAAVPSAVAERHSSASLPLGVLLAPDIASKEWLPLVAPPPKTGKAVDASMDIVDATVPGHPRALRTKVRAVNGTVWDVQVARPLSVSLQAGKQIRLTFWARSKDSCPVTVAVEQNVDPFTKVVYKVENLTPEWKQYTEEWVQAADTTADWAKMDFQLGHKVGEIELTGVIIRQVDDPK